MGARFEREVREGPLRTVGAPAVAAYPGGAPGNTP